jgi:TPR repeat protein
MLKFAAEHGIAAAQNRYGLLLKYGLGVPLDFVAAAEWFLKAEAQGELESTAHLANLQQAGDWIPADPEAFKKRLKKAVDAGNLYAQYEHINLTMRHSPNVYNAFKTTNRTCQKIFDEFKKEQNDFDVQYRLGQLSIFLFGADGDFSVALEWLKKAAEQGLPIAQFVVAHMLLNGHGVPKDPLSGLFWYEKAATNDFTTAQYCLGYEFFEGKTVPQDFETAYKWLKKAALKGHPLAQVCLGTMYIYGQAVKQDSQTAIKWYLEAANQGNEGAQVILADIYFNGTFATKDLGKALEWAKKGAAHGNGTAQRILGDIYFYGMGVPRDLVQAAIWYTLAAFQDVTHAQRSLAMMYLTGMGVPQDKAKAASLLEKSVENGDTSELLELGRTFLLTDKEDPQNLKKSFFVFKVAAKLGNRKAMQHVGLLYLIGKGVPKNIEKAKKWLSKAAKLGDPIAKKTLEENF